MNRTANQIVTNALRVCRVFGPDQTVPAFALTDGLRALEEMLAVWRSDSQLHQSPTYVVPTFANQTDTVSVADALVMPITYLLADILAPEHGQTMPASLVMQAQSALRQWRTKVAASLVVQQKLETAEMSEHYGDVSYDIDAG